MKLIIITAIWCPSCLVMKKIYNKIILKYPNIDVLKLDYDFDKDQVKKYQVTNILPVLIIEKKQIEIKRIVGEHTEEEIDHIIKECLHEL